MCPKTTCSLQAMYGLGFVCKYIKNVRCGLWLTKPPINLLRLDYEVGINRLQNSLIVRALLISDKLGLLLLFEVC